MPMVIPLVAGAAASYFVGTVLAYGVIAGAIAGFAASSLAGAALGKNSAPTQSTFDQQRGALINIAENDAPIPVIYGFRRVGVIRVFTESQPNTDNLGLLVVLVVAEGEISGFVTVDFDQVQAYPVPVSRFSGYVAIYPHVGTDGQAAENEIVIRVPLKWTSTDRLQGVAYIGAALHWTQNAYPGGLPNITADVRGKLVYDPRVTGSPTVFSYSNNPALCIRDYLTNTRYGCSIPEGSIDDETFIEAANHFDELVSYPSSASPSTEYHARYTLDGRIDTSQPPIDNLNAMLSSCRSMLIYSGGKYKLLADKAETPTAFEFNEDNIIGSWAIRMGSKRSRFNRVKANWFNPDRNWEPDLAIYDNETDRATDNDLLLEQEIELPYTTNGFRALRLAQIEQKQSRFSDFVEFTATIAALQVEVGDVVPITHSTPGYASKLFRILRMEMLNSDEVRVSAAAYSSAVYTTDDLTAADLVSGNTLPDPFDLDIDGLTASSGTDDLLLNGDGTVVPRIRLRWTFVPNQFITWFEVQFSRSSVSPTEWSDAPDIGPGLTEGFVFPVEDGVTYDVRLRAVTSLGNTSEWAYVYGHTVIGKTAVPADVTGFSAQQHGDNVNFRWNQVSDADLAGYEIRYNDEGVTDWDSAAVITSVTRGTAITNGFVPPGTWELLIKARDTSENYSANADTATITVENQRTVVSETEESPLWIGEKSNLVRHWTGVLVPDSTSTAASLGADLFDECVPDPYPTCTYTAPEIDITFDAYVRVWGDIVSSVAPGSTEPDDPVLQVDYRAAAAAYDGPESWTIGLATGRYFRVGFTFTTANGILIFTGFAPVIDQSEGSRHAESVAVAAGGTNITFDPQFHFTPNLQVTAQSESSPTEARFAFFENLGTTGARIHVTNPAGTSIGGTANWSATGV